MITSGIKQCCCLVLRTNSFLWELTDFVVFDYRHHWPISSTAKSTGVCLRRLRCLLMLNRYIFCPQIIIRESSLVDVAIIKFLQVYILIFSMFSSIY